MHFKPTVLPHSTSKSMFLYRPLLEAPKIKTALKASSFFFFYLKLGSAAFPELLKDEPEVNIPMALNFICVH